MAESKDFIDVSQLIANSSVEELNRLADEYFSQVQDWNFHLAKPLGAIDEAPQLLTNFAILLQGLSLCRGMTVLEFGAGTCWASRFLSQLGCQVIAMDVSATALRMGQELYERHPPFGTTPQPLFNLFDGRRMELADESVDRILGIHALHHVANCNEVLSEFARVLKNDGIAGFAEPGPEHSRSPQSQEEMRTFGVIENDIDTKQIWSDAAGCGFTEMKIAIFNIPPFLVSQSRFDSFQMGEEPVVNDFMSHTREFLRNQRTFFLYKGKQLSRDSRYFGDLSATIQIEETTIQAIEGKEIRLHAEVENNSSLIWLPRGSGVGAVHLGCHVLDSNGKVLHHSYHWEPLSPGDGVPVLPRQRVKLTVTLPPLPLGSYTLEFDMVSYDVAWFAQNGSRTIRVPLEVLPEPTTREH